MDSRRYGGCPPIHPDAVPVGYSAGLPAKKAKIRDYHLDTKAGKREIRTGLRQTSPGTTIIRGALPVRPC